MRLRLHHPLPRGQSLYRHRALRLPPSAPARRKSPACAKYTHSHPVEALEGLWRAPDLASAARMEYAVKRLPREKKLLLLREPERLGALLPTLAAEEYTHQPGVSLEMCLEGQYDER